VAKTFKLQKSKMTHNHHFAKSKIATCLQQIEWLWRNLDSISQQNSTF